MINTVAVNTLLISQIRYWLKKNQMQRNKRLDISIVQRLDGTFWSWQEINGHPLIWLDYGATSQKLNQVIDAVSQFYQQTNSNLYLAHMSLRMKL